MLLLLFFICLPAGGGAVDDSTDATATLATAPVLHNDSAAFHYNYTTTQLAATGWTGFLRRSLVGSNCVLIERGTVTRYYTCIGCDVELAVQCVTDMRTNASFNVAPNCAIDKTNAVYDPTCCPYIVKDRGGNKNLAYTGAAYPMTLDCIAKVGCSASAIFAQLVEECLNVCPLDVENGINVDQSGTKSICYAKFNTATRARGTGLSVVVAAVTTTVALIVFLVLG